MVISFNYISQFFIFKGSARVKVGLNFNKTSKINYLISYIELYSFLIDINNFQFFSKALITNPE